MGRGNRLRRAMVALVTLITLSIAGFGAGPASAAGAAQHVTGAAQSRTLSAGSVEKTQRITLHLTASPNYAVTCYAYINGPYETGTVVETYQMTVVGSTTCSRPVLYLNMTVYLYWNDLPARAGSATGTSSIPSTVSGRCIAGTWFGELDLSIVWPSGVTGPPTYTARTNPVVIDSC